MSPLAVDALTGIDFAAGHALNRGLVELGAREAGDQEPVDLFVVSVVPGSSLDLAAGGQFAGALTEAFANAREAFARLRPGGCLLFVLAGASADHADTDPARAAIGSLTRTLALEWAPDRRVNALVCARPEDAIEAVALIAWPASRTLTGAVLDLVASRPV
jgi:NAD(P)-dependent dehydrogenase (short-subunit alcohol dehydrogenase family)